MLTKILEPRSFRSVAHIPANMIRHCPYTMHIYATKYKLNWEGCMMRRNKMLQHEICQNMPVSISH